MSDVSNKCDNGSMDDDGVRLRNSSLGKYCDELRNWINEVNCWQAFHKYSTTLMAYQNRIRLMESFPITGGVGQRLANTDTTDVNGEERGARDFQFPVPASARDVAVVRSPNGSSLLAAHFVVASYLRRFMAELIDFFFAFFIKLIIVYYLVEMEFVDLSRFDKLLGNEADLQTLVDVTQELFPLELLGKLACSFLEALCLSQTLFPQFSGRTPGKYIMRVRVIDCVSLAYVAGAPPSVVRVTGGLSVPFKAYCDYLLWMKFRFWRWYLWFDMTELLTCVVNLLGKVPNSRAILRSMLKNILIYSLVPFSTVAFAFNHNRAIYDILARTIVIVD